MWARRQAHETAVHRFDAEHAGHSPSSFDPEFTADGIDELLAGFAPVGNEFPITDSATMFVETTDTDDRWHMTMTPDGIKTFKGTGPSDVALTGQAADLYLALWNRSDDASVEVTGNRDVLEIWHTNHRIRWPREAPPT